MASFTTRVEAIAADAEDIPTLHEIAWKALKTVSDQQSGVQDLERVISRDQALTAKMLRMANSSLLGASGRVRTLKEAILALGPRRLRSLVLASSLDGLVRSRALKNRHIWEHALGVAVASGYIASQCDGADADKAFVCGLMHDLGKVVLDRGLAEYQQVLDLVYNEGRTFQEAEQQILGFDHTEIGGLVATKWNLPEEILETARYHHDPFSAGNQQLAAIVGLADAVCLKHKIGPSHRPQLDLSSLDACRILSIEESSLLSMAVAVADRFKEEKRFLGVA